MTDQELYDKIVKILGDHYGNPHDDYFGGTIDPQTVAQLIMDEVTDMCRVVRDKAWSSGYYTCWMELKLDD